jgi:phosphoenolpyruvate synthase/pyruvate phosphate dikinase
MAGHAKSSPLIIEIDQLTTADVLLAGGKAVALAKLHTNGFRVPEAVCVTTAAYFVNVRGISAILRAIRLVWASLWSDRALLYRKELGLDVSHSTIAVVVQEMVTGGCSGVAFSQSPDQTGCAMIEAVWGLNQGMVDGTVEPDRWQVERDSGAILSQFAPQRREAYTWRHHRPGIWHPLRDRHTGRHPAYPEW